MAPTYDRSVSLLMAQFTGLAYSQLQGLQVILPVGWKLTATFTAPEIEFARRNSQLESLAASGADLSDASALRAAGIGVGVRTVPFGFAAVGPQFNSIVLRGTQTAEEVVVDLTGVQVPVPVLWGLKLAKVHLGFLVMFLFLRDQIEKAAQAFGNSNPVLCVGHSLGGALATVAALDLNQFVLGGAGKQGGIQLYTQAQPRVGDPVFKQAYDAAVPGSFRVVNYADVVPVLAPTSITVGGVTYEYAHIGQAWSFLWQQENVEGNHSLVNTYIPAIQKQVETNVKPAFPTSGF